MSTDNGITRKEIISEARSHLAGIGSWEVSLDSLARALGGDPAEVTRQFASRDELLTEMVRQAYAELGAVVSSAEREVDRIDFLGRWLAVATTTRTWSLDHPQDHTLLFASPVPGYSTPVADIDPAVTLPILLMEIVRDAAGAGRSMPITDVPMSRSVTNDLKSFRTLIGLNLDDPLLTRASMAWIQLIGSISFELLGIAHVAIQDVAAHFEYQMRVVGHDLGLG